jgi:TonB-linked SusC/RagA family outer membrane protein
VVVGYGTEKKKNVTGAVSTVQMSSKEGQPITNAQNVLYGVSGVYANLNSSQPGVDRAMIRIRGVGTLSNSNPLILVDGVEYPMSELDPSDIASITVLKGANAAIYGSKAANGVILVTTKKGKGETKVNYNYYYGVQKPTMLPHLVWNSIAYMKALNQAERNEGKDLQTFSKEDIGGYELGMLHDPFTYPSNNWYDISFRNGNIQKHNLSISGGSDQYNYRLSLGFLDRHGIFFGHGNKEHKYYVGINTSAHVSKRFTFGLSLHGNFRTYRMPLYGTGKNMSVLGRALPIENDTLADGNYGYTFLRIPGHNNWSTTRQYAYEGFNKKRINRFLTMLHGSYKFPLGISYKIKVGADKYDGLRRRFVPRFFELQAMTRDTLHNNSVATAPRSYTYDSNTLNLHFYNTLNWDGKFNHNHNLSIMIGSSYDYYNDIPSSAEVQGYNDALLTDLSVGTVYQNITGHTTQEGLASYFGRVNYNYKERYIVQGIFRFDGSSRFAPSHRWGFFPGISAGWIISDEPFIKDNGFINLLKLRASVGELGNQAVALYSYENTVTLGHNYSFGGPNGTLASGAASTAAADPTTTWETTTDYDMGVNLSIWNNRISFKGDVYKKLTTGILRTVNLPSQVGNLTGPKENVGSVSNVGYEINISYQDKLSNGFGYKILGNMAYNKNKVVDLDGEVIYNYDTNLPTITKEGHPIDAYYVLDATGIFQSDKEVAKHAFQSNDTKAGYLKFRDVKKDGIINGDDRIIADASSIMPKYTFAFGLNLGYKGISLSAQFQGVIGIKNAPVNRPATPLNNGAGLTWEWLTDSWTPNRRSASLPILTEANYSDIFRNSTFLLKDASYLRLKTAQLRYSIPKNIMPNKLSSLSVYINAENWFTFTPFDLGDPEAMYNAKGVSHYPMLKTLSAGINITF